MSHHRLSTSTGFMAPLIARGRFRFATLAMAVLTAMPVFAAQLASQLPSVPRKSRTHAKPNPSHSVPVQEQVAPTPAAPEPPHWPANEAPAKPSVTWDGQGLRIDAANASLRDILNDVSTVTGAKVEGMGADERVFGAYGPGEARDVLSQLLHGSAYNVLMIGDQGTGTPREIVLSARRSGGNVPAARPTPENQDEDIPQEQPESEDQPPPPQPLINGQPPMPPQGPPGAPRTPQQVLQELQQRQQQIQDQQQQQLQQLQQQQPH